MGYVARRAENSDAVLRQGIIMGSTLASFAVEDFSLERVRRLRDEEIRERYAAFLDLVRVAPLEE